MVRISISLTLFLLYGCQCVKHAKELYSNISKRAEESKYWRPVKEDRNKIITYLGVTLIQIMDLDEKSKKIILNVWLRQIWMNKYLSWEPSMYGNIKCLYLPHSSMWLPDIVLLNNADGKYETQFPNKPILHYNGMVDWTSPAIFQSTCDIDVKYFPYDEQTCFLNFGSWTYNKDQVKLLHMKHLESLLERSLTPVGSEQWNYLRNYSKKRSFKDGAFLMNYYKSGEWDLMQTPTLIIESNNENEHDTIKFGVRIRRKALFYNLNLIFPMIGLSVLAALSFYLPANSGEKITLSMLILLTITVFFVLLTDSVPPTSLVIPIINQYLIISFLLIAVSVLLSTVVLNFNSRSSATHKTIPPFIQKIFLGFLPRIMFMKRPPPNQMLQNLFEDFKKYKPKEVENNSNNDYSPWIKRSKSPSTENLNKCLNLLSNCLKKPDTGNKHFELKSVQSKTEIPSKKSFLEEVRTIVFEIADNFVDQIESKKIENDWTYAAIVMDRLILFIFCFFSFLVAMVTCLQSPVLYDLSLPINETLYNNSKINLLLHKLIY